MIISVINRSKGALSDGALRRAIRGINRQIAEDFAPHWGFAATLRLERLRTAHRPTAKIRGQAVLYVRNTIDPTADGYHTQYDSGVPYGNVFLGVAKQIPEDWSVTLSHEALELVADPQINLRVVGPHPEDRRRRVFHWFEMCDAVQGEWYEIGGVKVSNFVLPAYFAGVDDMPGPRDFVGKRHKGTRLLSFGINPGGYIQFFDPRLRPSGRNTAYSRPADTDAATREKVHRKAHHRRPIAP